MNRRGFLGAILAAGSAPAIIKIENAMRLWVPRAPSTLVTLRYGVGILELNAVRAGQAFKNIVAATTLDRFDNLARANALSAALGRQIEHEIASRPEHRIVLSG